MAIISKDTSKSNVMDTIDDGGALTASELRNILTDIIDSSRDRYGSAIIRSQSDANQGVEVRYTQADAGWIVKTSTKPQPVLPSITLNGAGSGNSMKIELPEDMLLRNQEPNDFQLRVQLETTNAPGLAYSTSAFDVAGIFTLRVLANSTLAQIKSAMETFDWLGLQRQNIFQGHITITGSGSAILASSVLPSGNGESNANTLSFAGGTNAHFVTVAPGTFASDKEVLIGYAPGFHELHSLVKDWGNGISIHPVGADENNHLHLIHPPEEIRFDFVKTIREVEVLYWQDTTANSSPPGNAGRKVVGVEQGLFPVEFPTLGGNRRWHFQIPDTFVLTTIAVQQANRVGEFSTMVVNGTRRYDSRVTSNNALEVLLEIRYA